MKQVISLTAWATLLLVTAGAASPLRVRTRGARSQQVIMCPDCKERVTCVTAGDYQVGLDVNLDNPKTGAAVFAVHVRDAARNPVPNARVRVALTMPQHRHPGREALSLRHTGHGRYEVATTVVMPGAYRADVTVGLPGGDAVRQSFSFSR